MILINKLARIAFVAVLLGESLFAHAGFWDNLPGDQASKLNPQELNLLAFRQHLSSPGIGVAFHNQLALTFWQKMIRQTTLFKSINLQCWQCWQDLETQFIAQLQKTQLPPIEVQKNQISREVITAQVIVQKMLSILQQLGGDVQPDSQQAKALQEIVQLMTSAQQELNLLQGFGSRVLSEEQQICAKQWQNFVRRCLISAKLSNQQQPKAGQLAPEVIAYSKNQSELQAFIQHVECLFRDYKTKGS